MKRLLSFLLISLALFSFSNAQCPAGEVELEITITFDEWAYECSWIAYADGQIVSVGDGDGFADDEVYTEVICVPSSACIEVNFTDTYGDGFNPPGGYTVSLDGTIFGMGGEYGEYVSHVTNCPPGSSCDIAEVITAAGVYQASNNSYWYSFSPSQTGTYLIDACNNSCNTTIWVYDFCGGTYTADQSGTIYYNDDFCGSQASLNAVLVVGETYIIRIGDNTDLCSAGIDWELSYVGPVTGCIDPAACNFNALATVDDGSCIYPGDPDCGGPDLVLRQDVLETSLFLDILTNVNPCLLDEQCVTGFGTRYVVRFTTHIDNNGDLDYYIGQPPSDPTMGNSQFEYDACHGHWHQEGYAEYVLYDSNGQALPSSYKNGFCVLDLVCNNGGTAQYGCSNMGISAGCGDIYSSGLECQWIDITDVPDGDYTLVVRTNWNFTPDVLGNHELDYDNNWAQVCINVFDDGNGGKDFTQLASCPSYTDCLGVTFGSAQLDCNGVCDGGAVAGDLNVDGVLDAQDTDEYIAGIINGSAALNVCSDLNGDGVINVWDAAFAQDCDQYGEAYVPPLGGLENHCDFPTSSIVNILDTAYLSIENANFVDQYVDIQYRSANSDILAYQFTVSGIEISSTQNLGIGAPNITIDHNATGDVVALSYDDSEYVERFNNHLPLVRLYFNQITGNEICIDAIESVVNLDRNEIISNIEGGCLAITDIDEYVLQMGLTISPNPMINASDLSFSNPDNLDYVLSITDMTGKVVRTYPASSQNQYLIERGSLNSGVYYYQLVGEATVGGKFVIQ